MDKNDGFTVLMPTYNQCGFIRRAIDSLLKQTFKEWELLIINDGCTDDTEAFISDYLTHSQIRYLKNDQNRGLGQALNLGLTHAACHRIAYLPSDDFYYTNHLQIMHEQFEKHPEVILAIAGVKYDSNVTVFRTYAFQSKFTVPYHCPLLVQCAHRLTDDRWTERHEFVTYDLSVMFWNKLTGKGIFSFTGEITCNWTNHPEQRHKIIQENTKGGINAYRSFYQVKEPTSYTDIGPLPFGNVQDIPYEKRLTALRKLNPDLIYAQSGSISVPLAHEIWMNKGNIPMVCHFKEGPFFCMRLGYWSKLVELYSRSEGCIYINPEIKRWYESFIKRDHPELTYILDGDLPSKRYFSNRFSSKLSAVDGAFHTVIPGRVVGIHPADMRQLAASDIHLHLYTNSQNNRRDDFVKSMTSVAPRHFHVHSQCEPEDWTEELSRYDAGWLHCFRSENNGDLMRANWDDFNMPSRMNTLAAAGLPVIQYDNSGHIVASQEFLKSFNVGLFYKEIDDLRAHLADRQLMDTLNRNMLKNRFRFCFDEYVPELMDFFRKVISIK